MNVFFTPIADRYTGIALASVEIFDSVTIWEPKSKPIFDVFSECQPDIVCCDIKYINSTFIQACNEHSGIKIILFADGVPKHFKPDIVCCPPSLSTLMRKHLEKGDHKTLYLSDCADVITYWHGEADKALECDIAFWSNGWIEEAPIQKIELFSALAQIGRLKIVGKSKIPIPNYLGNIGMNKVVSFLKSSKIAIDWNAENILNQAANRIFTISTVPNSLFPVIDSDNLEKQITSYLKNDKARRKKAKKAQKEVLSTDTCWNRLREITEALCLTNETNSINQKIEELKQCVEE